MRWIPKVCIWIRIHSVWNVTIENNKDNEFCVCDVSKCSDALKTNSVNIERTIQNQSLELNQIIIIIIKYFVFFCTLFWKKRNKCVFSLWVTFNCVGFVGASRTGREKRTSRQRQHGKKPTQSKPKIKYTNPKQKRTRTSNDNETSKHH